MTNAEYINSTKDGGMIKLIYSDVQDGVEEAVDCMVDDGSSTMRKSASTIFGLDYDKLAADKDHVGIHLVALGAYERYGLNRNGDGFSKNACMNYHNTFVKYGNLFEHHRNKDPDKRLGVVKASVFNPTSDRIELYVHANKEKAEEHLKRYDKEGSLSFSMACKVASDRCTRCNTVRKGRNDPNQCDHVRNELGKMANDGTITGTMNDEPYFFDISFVGRPADRIAWDLKVASGLAESSVDLASNAGLYVPDALARTSESSTRKYSYIDKIANMQKWYRARIGGDTAIGTSYDNYLFEFRKLADAGPTADVLDLLRSVDTKTAMRSLARAGVILEPISFFKYAMGTAFSEIEPYLKNIHEAVTTVFEKSAELGCVGEICEDATFDVDFSYNPFAVEPSRSVTPQLFDKLAESAVIGPYAADAVIRATIYNDFPKIAVDTNSEIGFNSDQTFALARKYAAYKLAAVDAAVRSERFDTDIDTIAAVAAVQNIL